MNDSLDPEDAGILDPEDPGDILAMLTSIEEAIEISTAGWSAPPTAPSGSIPAPAGSWPASVETPPEQLAAPTDQAPEAPPWSVEPPLVLVPIEVSSLPPVPGRSRSLPSAFQPRSEPRRQPDPPPRRQGVTVVGGTTAQVLGRFRWSG